MVNIEMHEVLLVQCNVVSNKSQRCSRLIFTFVLYELFGQLVNNSTYSLLFLNTCSAHFSYIINFHILFID